MKGVSEETRKRVDEDWKRSAKKSEDALESENASKGSKDASTGSQAASTGRASTSSEAAAGPVDFSALISSLAVQTLVHLGQVQDPLTGEKHCDMERAKHTIGLIEILHEKTKGNLTEEESRLIDDTLYGLRMSYVAVSGEQEASS